MVTDYCRDFHWSAINIGNCMNAGAINDFMRLFSYTTYYITENITSS